MHGPIRLVIPSAHLPLMFPSFPSFPSSLKRRPQTKGPEPPTPLPLLRDRIVQPRNGEAEQIGPDRNARGLQRRAHPDADRRRRTGST